MNDIHSMNKWFAKKYGPCAAVVFNGFLQCCEENRRLNKCKKEAPDGKMRHWFFNTVEEILGRYPYMSESTLKRAIALFKKEGLVYDGTFNKNPFDKTKWYCLTDKGENIYGELEREFSGNKVEPAKCCSVCKECTDRCELADTGEEQPQQENTASAAPQSQSSGGRQKKKKKSARQNKGYSAELYNDCIRIIEDNRKIIRSQGKQVDETVYPVSVYRAYLKRLFRTYGTEKVVQGLRNSIRNTWLVSATGYSLTALTSNKIFPKCIGLTDGAASKGTRINYGQQDYSEAF